MSKKAKTYTLRIVYGPDRKMFQRAGFRLIDQAIHLAEGVVRKLRMDGKIPIECFVAELKDGLLVEMHRFKIPDQSLDLMEEEPDAPLTFSEVQSILDSGCHEPNCKCESHLNLAYIHGLCHPESPTWVELKRDSKVITVVCAECGCPITQLTLADDTDGAGTKSLAE